MPFDLSGRHALVTGAGQGIGAAIALALAGAGADVVVHYGSSADGAERVAADIGELGRKAKALRADVTDAAEVARLVDDAAGLFINNTKYFGPFTKNVKSVRYCPIGDAQDIRWIEMEG